MWAQRRLRESHRLSLQPTQLLSTALPQSRIITREALYALLQLPLQPTQLLSTALPQSRITTREALYAQLPLHRTQVPNIALQQKLITILIHLCALLFQPHIQPLNIVLQQGHITTREPSHALHLQRHLTATLSTAQAPSRTTILIRFTVHRRLSTHQVSMPLLIQSRAVFHQQPTLLIQFLAPFQPP